MKKTALIISCILNLLLILLVTFLYLRMYTLPSNPAGIYERPVVDFKPQAQTRGWAALRLANVRFRWTENVYADIYEGYARILPVREDRLLDFDDPASLRFEMQYANVELDYQVLEYLLNNHCFSFEESTLRNLKVTAAGSSDKNKDIHLIINGEIRLVVWLSFTMQATVGIENNRIAVTAHSIESLGISFVQGALGMAGLTLEDLVAVQAARGVSVAGNKILFNVPELFPNPVVFGTLTRVEAADSLRIQFGKKDRLPVVKKVSDVYNHFLVVDQGLVKFGPLRLVSTRLQMSDTDESDFFEFNMPHYLKQLDQGTATVSEQGLVNVMMPDYSDLARY